MLIERAYKNLTEDFVKVKATQLSIFLNRLIMKHAVKTGAVGQVVSRTGEKNIQLFWVSPHDRKEQFPGVVWQIDDEGVLLEEKTLQHVQK